MFDELDDLVRRHRRNEDKANERRRRTRKRRGKKRKYLGKS